MHPAGAPNPAVCPARIDQREAAGLADGLRRKAADDLLNMADLWEIPGIA
jgi:hypothetical protein